jgi:hypothetical protein
VEKAEAEMRTKAAEYAETARVEIAAARAEAAAACSQRDIARMTARRAAAAAEGHWRGNTAEAKRQAAEWRNRRLERFFPRSWIQRASRLIPASGRRLVRERLLGGKPH